jgi:PmbA protein
MKREEIPSHLVELGIKQGATDIAANLIELDQTMIRFSNNEVTASKNFREVMVNVFVMIEKRRAGSTFSIPSSKALERAMKKLVEMAKISPSADVYAHLPKGPFKYNPALLKSPRVSSDPTKLINYVKEAIDGACKSGAKRVAGSLTATNLNMVLETSGQASAVQSGSGLEMSVRAFVSETASGHSLSIAESERDFEPVEAGRRAGEIAKMALNPVEGQPGRYTVLLGPMVFAHFVNQVGIQSSAFTVDAGQSFLIDKLGSKVASEKFMLIDDPTLRSTYGARAFDDEGVPTKRNTIVEKGILKTYLHNSTTAKKFGAETTANAGLIMPTPWNLVVEPGEKPFEEMLSEIDEGIYVTNNWYLRYQNYQKGDFSTIPRDGMFQIKNGQIANPVRNLRISDNMLKIFQNIRELSKERLWIKWWEVPIPTLTPYATVEDLNFTKSTM